MLFAKRARPLVGHLMNGDLENRAVGQQFLVDR